MRASARVLYKGMACLARAVELEPRRGWMEGCDLQALDRLEDDEERDQDEEDAVGESGERLDAPVAVGEVGVSAARIVCLSGGRVPVCEPLVGRPACHDARDEAYADRHAVEGHVDGCTRPAQCESNHCRDTEGSL